MNKVWTDEAWEDYLYWQSQDKKTLKRINVLLQDIDRNGYEGIGKPEDHPEGVLVSALVLGRLGPEWSGVAFAPATGPNDNCIRDSKGMIQAVTKLVTV